MDIPFIKGHEYNRRLDLHGKYGGSRQSGISSCADYPMIFIFTNSSGEKHGYADRFDPENGFFYYSGEGQSGDMEFKKGNKALRDHFINKKHVLLFEKTKTGQQQYIGECTYVTHHFETQPDTDGNMRQAIIFELAIEALEEFIPSDQKQEKRKIISKATSLDELRELAKTGSGGSIHSRSTQVKTYYRSHAVKKYALARSEGICEACNSPAPFKTAKNEPYLEVHHLFRVADGGPDDPDGVAAICPTCHRRIHHGYDGKDFNKRVAAEIRKKEMEFVYN